MAQGAGLLSADSRANGGIFASGDLQNELVVHARSYAGSFRPIPTKASDEASFANIGYATGAFFLWLGKRYGGADYLAELYNRQYIDKDGPFTDDMRWIDQGLSANSKVATGFEFLLPQFAADFGSWGRGMASAGVIDADKWRDSVFGGACPELTLTSNANVGKPYDSITLDLEPLSVQCVIVHVDSSFKQPVRLDSFAYVDRGDQAKRLDSLHLAVVERYKPDGSIETCEQHARNRKPQPWPICVAQPFLKERGDAPASPGDAKKLTRTYKDAAQLIGVQTQSAAPEGVTHVRIWKTEDEHFDKPGTKTVFAIANVATTPEETTHEKKVTLVFGARSVNQGASIQLLGAPRVDDFGKLPAGISGTLPELMAMAQGAGPAITDFEPGYAEYGLVGHLNNSEYFAVPIEISIVDSNGEQVGSYNIALTELPPLGVTGQANAFVHFVHGGQMGMSGDCSSKDKPAIKAQIKSSGVEGVTFSVSSPIAVIDPMNPASGCKQGDPFNAELTIPFGWRFDAVKAPRDVVTPGIHDYVDRYLANLRAMGVPAAQLPAFAASGPSGGQGQGNSQPGSGNAGSNQGGTLSCDCSCTSIQTMFDTLDGASVLTPAVSRASSCLQSCLPQVMQCRGK